MHPFSQAKAARPFMPRFCRALRVKSWPLLGQTAHYADIAAGQLMTLAV